MVNISKLRNNCKKQPYWIQHSSFFLLTKQLKKIYNTNIFGRSFSLYYIFLNLCFKKKKTIVKSNMAAFCYCYVVKKTTSLPKLYL